MKYLKLFEELSPKSVLLNLKDNIDSGLTGFICSHYPKGSKILEISCGNAADSLFLKESGYDVTCTEFNDEYVDNAKSIGLKCIKQNTLEKFPFQNNEFDLIYSRLGLHYFTEDQLYSVFKELKRIGKSILLTVKLEEDKGNEWTGKVILTSNTWKRIVESQFNIEYFNIKTGLLYGNKSRWIEIYATGKVNENNESKIDEEEIKNIFNDILDRYNLYNLEFSTKEYKDKQDYILEVIIREKENTKNIYINKHGWSRKKYYLIDFDEEVSDEKNEMMEEMKGRMLDIGYEYNQHYINHPMKGGGIRLFFEFKVNNKVNEGRLLKDDEKQEIRDLFQTFFDQEGWRETDSYGEPDSGITYHIQNSHRYMFDSELDKGKPIHLSSKWDGKELHKNDRAMDHIRTTIQTKDKYIHDSLVINIMFGKEYTWDDVTNIRQEIKDFIEDLNDLGYPGYIWRPNKRNLRIHISTKEADKFLKSISPDE